MSKRYRWLKLQDDFFERLSVKKILKSDNLYKILTVYIKLQLTYLTTEGIIEAKTNYSLNEELAIRLDVEEDEIKELLEILEETNAISLLEDGSLLLNEVAENIGSEGSSAKRVREYRKRKQEG